LDGLSALKIIMEDCPVPVLMVSSVTTEGADATLHAFDLGAIDFISKELSSVSVNIINIKDELIAKVKAIVGSTSVKERFAPGRVRKAIYPKSRGVRAGSMLNPGKVFGAVVIGISTGGPHALLQFLPRLPDSFPIGIAVVQHMPAHFTKSMAERLNGLCPLRVKEAEQGDMLLPGTVLIAPGGRQMTFDPDHRGLSVVISDEPRTSIYRPSATIMMTSAAEASRGPLVGVIMTGMGKDGLEGLRLIKKKGGCVLAQDEKSCVVYGMPKAAVDDGIADYVLPLEQIPRALQMIAKVQ
jgi:two-component system, chemotaxis family, protein-glutamate methylesterase/glutaminase